jgi:hypothetical protein
MVLPVPETSYGASQVQPVDSSLGMRLVSFVHRDYPGRIRDNCPDQCVDIAVMLAFRLAMIQMEPPMTRKTISTPNARARMLFV